MVSINNFTEEDENFEDISVSSETTDKASSAREDAEERKAMRDKIIKAEEAHVKRARIIVVLVISACAAAVITAVLKFARLADEHTFEVEYEGFADDIASLVQWEVQNNFALMQQLSASVTASAILQGAVFPNLTQPHFEITAGYVDGLTGIMSAAFAPLVKADERLQWEEYSVLNQAWIEEAKRLKKVHPGHGDPLHGTIQDHECDRKLLQDMIAANSSIPTQIFRYDENGTMVPETSSPGKLYAPLWQVSPPSETAVNMNLLSDERFSDLFSAMKATNQSVLSAETPVFDMFDFLFDPEEKNRKANPHSFLMEPVYSAFEEEPELVGILVAITAWENLLNKLLPNGKNGIVCVIHDTCGNTQTHLINGQWSSYLGAEDLHDTKFDAFVRHVPIELYKATDKNLCQHELDIYSSDAFRKQYDTNQPKVYTSIVGLAFLLTSVVLVVYDRLVTRRQEKTMKSALQSNAIVASIFPEKVREQLMEEAGASHDPKNKEHPRKGFYNLGHKDVETHSSEFRAETEVVSRPIADFYESATLFFADLAGFTAWSCSREPQDVFLLLETLYGAFDKIAKRRRIFKVETIGDCYVAVCGCPTPRRDHAVAMARFARECLFKANEITRKLEMTLGPDTGDLKFRIGMHSGPVTGGVLRGDNARFQLFGDTVNTASRIESTGMSNRIHISKETAKLLMAAGKSHWVKPREDKVLAKGLGRLETFFLLLGAEKMHCYSETSTTSSSEASNSALAHCNNKTLTQPSIKANGGEKHRPTDSLLQREKSRGKKLGQPELDSSLAEESEKIQRLVEWSTDVLYGLLTQVVKLQKIKGQAALSRGENKSTFCHKMTSALQELKDTPVLPAFDPMVAVKMESFGGIKLDPSIRGELRHYIGTIASMYHHENPFHNFEHACQVTLSVHRLLKRLVFCDSSSPTKDSIKENKTILEEDSSTESVESSSSSYLGKNLGIASDPLTQFALIFSAIIHDVDHRGVSNMQLVKEDPEFAAQFGNKSVAEQNSLKLAWDLWMDDHYKNLRKCLCATAADLKQFRQILVNVVLATDIFDKELNAQRKQRWTEAFLEDQEQSDRMEQQRQVNRKYMIVIEHIIQASDVAHTMQHWHVYQKWNERLFKEMMHAFKAGRVPTDPSKGWYKGEILFFDHYIIPLAEKLQTCSVFGFESDLCLKNAMDNREEWILKGEEIVRNMVQACV